MFFSATVVMLVCLFISMLIPVGNWIVFVLWGIVYSIAYAAVVARFGLNQDERQSVIRKMIKK